MSLDLATLQAVDYALWLFGAVIIGFGGLIGWKVKNNVLVVLIFQTLFFVLFMIFFAKVVNWFI